MGKDEFIKSMMDSFKSGAAKPAGTGATGAGTVIVMTDNPAPSPTTTPVDISAVIYRISGFGDTIDAKNIHNWLNDDTLKKRFEKIEVAPLPPDLVLAIGGTHGQLPAIQKALKDGANIDAHRQGDKKTVLMLAVAKGHLECVQYLIAQNADVFAKDSSGNTALALAKDQQTENPSASPDLSAIVKILEKAEHDACDCGKGISRPMAAPKPLLT